MPSDDFIPRQHAGSKLFFKVQKRLYNLEHHFVRKLSSFFPKRFLSAFKWAESFLNFFSHAKHTPFVAALKVSKTDFYLKFGKIIKDIQIGLDSRPAMALRFNEPLRTELSNFKDKIFVFGFNVLDSMDPAVVPEPISVTLNFENELGTNNLKFKIPLEISRKKKAEIYFEPGNNWMDIAFDLSHLEGEKGFLTILLEAGPTVQEHYPSFAISTPQLLKKKSPEESKKIIFLGIEALTDPLFLSQYHSLKIDMPHWEELTGESEYYIRAYSQNDSTLPSIGTIFSGLFASQHGIGNYKSNPYIYEVQRLSNRISTVTELVKGKNFYTSASMTEMRIQPPYGWNRGFDSYFCVPHPWLDKAPDESRLMRTLDSWKHFDSYHAVYLDWLHWPTIHCSHERSPRLYDAQELADASHEEMLVESYVNQLKKLDKQLGSIINFLKEKGLYDTTMIILTGDHGSFLHPWGYHELYAFYERHIRVPLVIKWPDWHKKPAKKDHSLCNASLSTFKSVIEALDIELPDYAKTLPQFVNDKLDYAITETIMHPNQDHYALSLVGSEYKLVLFAKVDWLNKKIVSWEEERVYKVDSQSMHVKEDEIKLENDPIKTMRNYGRRFLEDNLKFQAEFGPVSFKDQQKPWEFKKVSRLKRLFFNA